MAEFCRGYDPELWDETIRSCILLCEGCGVTEVIDAEGYCRGGRTVGEDLADGKVPECHRQRVVPLGGVSGGSAF